MRIATAKLISEVQLEFNRAFPFLKLEFFRNGNLPQKNTEHGIKLNLKSHIGEGQTVAVDGELIITKEMKVKELEKRLKEQFGLNAQVFRHSGNLWLQTTITDDWTLEKQNQHGMELSRSDANITTKQ
jgi:hypothetical protein